ncbi:MAG TPA: ABC transporter ATP-binding protein, partial [Rhodospirillaceae bacterium]|nr:ABC transporter ATP-binding protein [Rhodospirillaceae bacterium]
MQLEIKDLEAYYGAIIALRGVTLRVPNGSIVSLIGANGAGKSTLLGCVSGNPKPGGGQIWIDGKDTTGLPPYEIARMGVAHVPEGRRIFPRLTVLENLQLGAALAPAGNFKKNLDEVAEIFPRLRERLQQRGGTLSGGEQQMLAIGRALMGEPKLLLLDEPSLGIAPILVQQIFAAIAAINQSRGITVFLVEQNAAQALRLSQYGYVLVNGKVEVEG